MKTISLSELPSTCPVITLEVSKSGLFDSKLSANSSKSLLSLILNTLKSKKEHEIPRVITDSKVKFVEKIIMKYHQGCDLIDKV